MASAGIAPPIAPRPTADPGTLAGAPAPADKAQAASKQQANQQDKANEFLRQVRLFTESLDDWARQYPPFAASARKAKEAVIDGMQKVVSGMDMSAEGQSPRIG